MPAEEKKSEARVEVPEQKVPVRKGSRRNLAVLAAAGLVLGLGLIRWRGEMAAAIEWAMNWVREMGPWGFFLAMATLPSVGFPLAPFVLAAGPVFVPILGFWGMLACAVLALSANVMLTYLLAARALRPLTQRALRWLGYDLPKLPKGSAWQVVFLVRLAPGLPFWLQGYLLGVVRLALIPYLVGSVVVFHLRRNPTGQRKRPLAGATL